MEIRQGISIDWFPHVLEAGEVNSIHVQSNPHYPNYLALCTYNNIIMVMTIGRGEKKKRKK